MKLLFIYFLIMIIATAILTKKSVDVEDLIVGDRNIGLFSGSMSIAATWIWAPALLISAEKAYSWGWVGLFWFLVPNILCLIIFSHFAKYIREQMPNGYSIAGFMGEKYDNKVKNVYLLQLITITIMSTIVQLLAGGMLISSITGMDFLKVTIILSVIAFCYSQFSGIEASVITDAVQMIIMLIACAIILPAALSKTGGITNMLEGINGVDGSYKSLFSSSGKEVFLSFGLASAIGLISGPFGDQAFWQRAFSIKKEKVKSSFILGAIMFAIIPLSMGAMGFIAGGMQMEASNVGMVNVELIQNYLSPVMFSIFSFIIISGLMSTVDSNLCSIISLVNDIKPNYTLNQAKITMGALLIVGIIGANIPGLTVSKLFMIYGITRSSTLATTILTLKKIKLRPEGVAAGIMAAIIVGLPTFIYGTISENNKIMVIGSLLSVTLPGVISIILTKIGEKNEYSNS